MRMPSHTALCSFVFSLLLTSALIPSGGDVALASTGAPAVQMAVQSALNGLRAQGFAGGATVELPAPAASPLAAPAAAAPDQASPLTPEVMRKMLLYIAANGKDKDVIPLVANTLGLSATGQTWAGRSVGVRDESKVLYCFYVSRGSEEDILVSITTPDIVQAFRAHRDGKIVTAFTYDLAAQKMAVRAPAEAQPDLDSALRIWADYINDRPAAGL